MSLADRLACAHDRNDETLNIALAQELATMQDNSAEILELFGIANHGSKAQKHDAIKVLYELAALKPFAFLDKVEFAIDLLNSKDNRMVWGAATLVAALAPRFRQEVIEQIDFITEKCMGASIIAQDRLLEILLAIADDHPKALDEMFALLEKCAPNQLPAYAEKAALKIPQTHTEKFKALLENRKSECGTEAKQKRIAKVLRKL